MKKKMLMLLSLAASIVTSMAQTIVDTDFTSPYIDGDLAGQQGWNAIAAGGTNAFNIISSGNGFAETATFSNSFDSAVGNQVYYSNLISNGVDSAWSGTITFRLECDPTPGLFATNSGEVVVGTATNTVTNIQPVAELVNAKVFEFGLSSDTSTTFESLDPVVNGNDGNDVVLSVGVRGSTDINFLLSAPGNADNQMLYLSNEDIGWDPEWQGADPTNAPVFNSEWITLNYTIRKTPLTDIYAAVVDVTVDGTTYFGTWQYTADDRSQAPLAYASDSVQFCMGHHRTALTSVSTGTTNGIINVNVDSVSCTYDPNGEIPVAAPFNLQASLGNLEIELTWEGGYEALGYDVYRSETDSESLTFYANVTTNSFTDSGLTDKRTYIYQIYGVYPGPILSPPTEPLAVRALGQSVVMGWGPSGDIVDGNTDASMTAEPPINGIVNVFGSGTDGSAFDVSSYGTNAAPLLYHTLQYPEGSTVNKNLLLDRDPPLDFYRLDIDVPVPAEMGWSSLKWVEGGYVNAVTQNPFIKVDAVDSRVAVRNGSTWYVSETLGNGEFTIMDLNAENWTELEVATATSTQIMTVADASFAPVELTDITAIGVFQDNLNENKLTYSFRMLVGSKPSAYDLWTDSFGIYNDEAASDNDYDEDGLDNTWEWGLGGNPADAFDFGITECGVAVDGSGNFVYIYPRLKNENARPNYYLTESENLVFTAGFTDQEGDYAITAGGTWPEEPDFEAVTNAIPTTDSVKFIKLNIE